MRKLKAFTLIEIICSTFLFLILIIILSNIIIFTNYKIKNNNIIINNTQTLDNLLSYLKNELECDNVRIISYNNENYIIKYQKLYKQAHNNYRLANKQLRFIKEYGVIVLETRNVFYKKENNTYIKKQENNEGINVVQDNVKNISISKIDDKLVFYVQISLENVLYDLSFDIDYVQREEFI